MRSSAVVRMLSASAVAVGSPGIARAASALGLQTCIAEEPSQFDARLLKGAGFLVLDPRMSSNILANIISTACAHSTPPRILLEPSDPAVATSVVESGVLDAIAVAKPDREELFALARAIRSAAGIVEEFEQNSSVTSTMVADENEDNEARAPAQVASTDTAMRTPLNTWADLNAALQPESKTPVPITAASTTRDSSAAATTAADPSEAASIKVDDGDDEANPLDYSLLVAAQTVLSAMVRPPSPHEGGTSVVLRAASEHGADAAVRACALALNACDLKPCRPRGATVDGRRHVLVMLGRSGVLWLSAPPLASHMLADLLLALPFFRAAALPLLHFDFRLVPAPQQSAPLSAAAVMTAADATTRDSANDAFAGALLAALSRSGGAGMAQALRAGMSASRVVAEAGAAGLNWADVTAGLADVESVDDDYDDAPTTLSSGTNST